MSKRFVALISLLLLSSTASRADDPISPEAKLYLDAALAIMQENFLHKEQVDWTQLKSETVSRAAGAQSVADTYPAIRFALAKLGDHHSYLQLTPDLARQESSRAAPAPVSNKPPSPFQMRRVPEGAIVPGSIPIAQIVIAQIVVPSFSGPDPDGFATGLQSIVAELASKNPCGWIVDLRGNGGGNMWPMLAGMGPLLGDEQPGSFLNATSKFKWFYRGGKAGVQGIRRSLQR